MQVFCEDTQLQKITWASTHNSAGTVTEKKDICIHAFAGECGFNEEELETIPLNRWHLSIFISLKYISACILIYTAAWDKVKGLHFHTSI